VVSILTTQIVTDVIQKLHNASEVSVRAVSKLSLEGTPVFVDILDH